jgi:hypothetical protein
MIEPVAPLQTWSWWDKYRSPGRGPHPPAGEAFATFPWRSVDYRVWLQMRAWLRENAELFSHSGSKTPE